MKRKFVNNLLFVLVLNLLIKPFWILGIDVGVQNAVGSNEYGLYYHLLSFSILLNIVLDFGITNYNNRNIAQHNQMLKRYFSGIFNVKIILSLCYLSLTFIAALLVGYEGEELWLLFLLGINQILSSFILYLRSNVSALHLFKTDALLSVMDRLLMILLCGILLWGNITTQEFQIEWFVYAQFWAYSVTMLVAFVVVFNKAKLFRMKVDIALFLLILRQSLPFALLVLLMSFYYRLDSVMIDLLMDKGKQEVGIYAQAYRILEAFNMLGFLFAGLLLPIFSKMIKDKLKVEGLLNISFNILFVPAVAITAVSLMHSQSIMDLLYVEHVHESAEVYAILMISFIAIALTYIYGTLLTANGSLRQLNTIALIGFATNFILNYLLIPKYGAKGAAIATLITQFFVSIAQIVVVKSLFRINYEFLLLIKYLVLLVLGGVISFYTKEVFSNFLVHAITTTIVFSAIAILLGLIGKDQLVALLKKKSIN